MYPFICKIACVGKEEGRGQGKKNVCIGYKKNSLDTNGFLFIYNIPLPFIIYFILYNYITS